MNFFIKLIILNTFILFSFFSFELKCQNDLFGIFSPDFHDFYTNYFDLEGNKNIYYYKNMKQYFYNNIIAGFLHALVSSKDFNNNFYIDLEKLFTTFDKNTLEKIKNFIKEEKIYKNQNITLKMLENNNNENNDNNQNKKIKVDNLYDLINECITNEIFISRNKEKKLTETELKKDYWHILNNGEKNCTNRIFIAQLKKEREFLKNKTQYDTNSAIYQKLLNEKNKEIKKNEETNIKAFSLYLFVRYLISEYLTYLIQNKNISTLFFAMEVI